MKEVLDPMEMKGFDDRSARVNIYDGSMAEYLQVTMLPTSAANDNYKVIDRAIIYRAEMMQVHSKFTMHGVSVNVHERIGEQALLEMGVKFGLKSNIGSLIGNAKAIEKTKHNTAESVISTAFRGWQMYHDILRLLSSSSGHGVSGGIWFYVHGEMSKEHSRSESAVPTMIDVQELESIADEELSFIGTQVRAYRGYIKAKYLKGRAAESTHKYGAQAASIDVEIPLTGSVLPSVCVNLQKISQYQKVHLNTNIFVTDRLVIEVTMHADLNGMYVQAGQLETMFNSLMIESLQNILETDVKGVSLGLGFGEGNKMPSFDSIGAQFQDRNRHVVDSISGLVGTKSVSVVVANALRLNGGMIANAERDANGALTDHGHMTLKFGELFVKHGVPGVALRAKPGGRVSYTL